MQLDNNVIALWLGMIILVGTISVVVWTAQTYASQGRLLFPFNAAISILGAGGIIYFGRYWIRPLMRLDRIKEATRSAYIMFPIVFAGFALVVPFASIAPQYAAPQPLDKIPDTARSVYARFGDVSLVGYEVSDKRYFPGDSVPIAVYWQVIKPSAQDYSLYLHATLDDGTDIGKVDTYPGAGRLRTSTWQAGAIYADTYLITLDKSSSAVSKLRMQVGWWDYGDRTLVDAVDQNNQALQSVMLDVGGFAPAQTHEIAESLISIDPVVFGDAIELTGYRIDGTILTLEWRSKASLATNDTVFVQALDANNQVVGQGDEPPTLPTRYWQAGEQFVTRHNIVGSAPIPSGQYRVILGWYDPVGGTRLPAAYPENAYTLPTQLVVP